MPRHPADHIPTDFGHFDLDVREPIVPQLYSQLRHKILTMELQPGASVGESELALAASVSRTPARQVIKQLVGECLLDAYTSRGTFVSRINVKRLRDALVIRRHLEPFLASECARDQNRAPLVARLRELLNEQKEALKDGAVDRAYQIDAAFHREICTREGDGLLWQTVRLARTEADRLHKLSRNRANSLQTALGHHQTIVDAIDSGDVNASFAAMDKHMQSNEASFSEIMQENPELFS